jgi:1,4-dihydroxy-2-naphthoate octaprenyltransferase
MCAKKINIKNWLQVSRANFLPASLIPFLIGVSYAFARGFNFKPALVILGLFAVTCLHLGANLLNDYHDYRSGADNHSKKYSSLFGGSRVIQQNIYSSSNILLASVILFLIGALLVLTIALIRQNYLFIVFLFIAATLAAEYSAPPLKLAYNRLGEAVIFFLFGVLLVVGSFYLVAEQFSLRVFALSLPISFLITAVIVCNEIPDFAADIRVNKNNLVSVVGVDKAYIIYGLLILLALFSVYANIFIGILPLAAVSIGILFLPAVKSFFILKQNTNNINKLISASRITIMLHSLVGIGIILLLIL